MTAYILDTCTLIWLSSSPEQLSASAQDIIDSQDARLLLTDVSAWEIVLKWKAGKLILPEPPRRWVESQSSIWSLERLAIRREDIYRSSELPNYHKDPFDRLLVAMALRLDAVILSPDESLRRYPVSGRW